VVEWWSGRVVESKKMKKNYKIQNTNYKQITSIRVVLRTYFKLSIVNCQLLIVNEISTHGLLQNLNCKQITKGSYGLHRGSFKLQTMTALIKSFCGGSRGAVFSKRAPLAAGGKKNEFI
jgi:hypothetical protein